MSVSEVIFWTALFAVVWHHIGFPMALTVLARLVRGRPAPVAIPNQDLPHVTLIVPAYNEAPVIAEKLRNLAALEYPAGRLRIVLVCDGCKDQTSEIARTSGLFDLPDGRFVLRDFPVNRGKVAILNECIAAARSEIIALSDASAMLAPDAISKAVAHFADPKVGVVCPTYRIGSSDNPGERAYWAYQARLKANEATVAVPMGAHGAFYLFRRAPWQPLPADTVNDDFVLPLRIVQAGFKAVYDCSIAAVERERTATNSQEFRRRVRIAAGNLQQVVWLAGLADPRRPGLAFVFLSGKGLRPFVPLLLLGAIVAAGSLALQGSGFYAAISVLTVGGLISGALAVQLSPPTRSRLLAVLGYFVQGHAASAVGAFLFLAGRHHDVWRASAAARPKRGTAVEP